MYSIIAVLLAITMHQGRSLLIIPVNSSGMYHEVSGTLRLVRSSWRVVIALHLNVDNINILNNDIDPIPLNISEICTHLDLEYCKLLLNYDIDNELGRRVQKLRREIAVSFLQLQHTEQDPRMRRGFRSIGTSLLTTGGKVASGIFKLISNADFSDIYQVILKLIATHVSP